MLLSEVSKTIDIKKILHQKSNKHFNKINSSSKEVDKKTIFNTDGFAMCVSSFDFFSRNVTS